MKSILIAAILMSAGAWGQAAPSSNDCTTQWRSVNQTGDFETYSAWYDGQPPAVYALHVELRCKPDTAVLSGQVSPGLLTIEPAPPRQPPLQCSKYQHVDHWPFRCGPAHCDGDPNNLITTGSCNAVCSAPPPDRCVDDLHTVTEREWQELMARLTALERAQALSDALGAAQGWSIYEVPKGSECPNHWEFDFESDPHGKSVAVRYFCVLPPPVKGASQ